MLKNYTPHDICIYDLKDCYEGDFGKLYLKDGAKPIRIIKSEGCVRVETAQLFAGNVEGIPVVRLLTGEPEGMPEPIVPGDIYIVSLMAARAIQQFYPRNAMQFVSVMGAVWDADGNTIGCTSLSVLQPSATID